MKIYQGKLQAKGFRIAIVVSRFNSFISERLLEGALEALQKMGAQEADLTVYKVPGSFEVPIIAKKVAKAKSADGILCVGALIRGDTPHFDFLSAEVTKGLAQIAMDDGVPVSFGILTVDTVEQGIERAGTKAGNKGYDAAFSLIETLNVHQGGGPPLRARRGSSRWDNDAGRRECALQILFELEFNAGDPEGPGQRSTGSIRRRRAKSATTGPGLVETSWPTARTSTGPSRRPRRTGAWPGWPSSTGTS